MNTYDTYVALSRQQSLQILENPMGSIYNVHYDGENLYVPTTFSFSNYIMNNDGKAFVQEFSRPPTRRNYRPKYTKSRVAEAKSIVDTILDDECFSDFVILDPKDFQMN